MRTGLNTTSLNGSPSQGTQPVKDLIARGHA
jgi:hypothetical protein